VLQGIRLCLCSIKQEAFQQARAFGLLWMLILINSLGFC
jgi:hypothetical protein